MTLDPRFERVVLAELAIREQRARPGDRSHRARVLAERLHRGRHDLLAQLSPPCPERASLDRARTLSHVPGRAGQLARVVERAAIGDRLDGAVPRGETLSTLLLLPDPRLGASWTAR